MVVALQTPLVIVPTVFKLARDVNVVLDVAVILPAKVAVEALPIKLAVILPALKFPLPSRFTIVLGVFKFVAALANTSAVWIVEELDPPTVFTVGEAAIPDRSPDN